MATVNPLYIADSYMSVNNKKGNVLLHFQGNNGYANTPKRNVVVRCVLFFFFFRAVCMTVIGEVTRVTAIQTAADYLV
jgi:hypothetical protein